MPTLAREFNISLSTVHDYIEEQRKLLRAQTIDLAAQEGDQALQLIDNAIEQVVPHINGQVMVKTELQRENSKGEPRLVVITGRGMAGPHEGLPGPRPTPGPQS